MVDKPKGLGLNNDFILWSLLGKKDVKPVSIEQRKNFCPDINSDKLQCRLSRHNRHPSSHVTVFDSYAYHSFQQEVQLCWSCIPGKEFGVMATTVIPGGVWIGPYEGKLVNVNEVDKYQDLTNMWEVHHQNRLRYFIDGTDLSTSSWMRFIQCARNKDEQNASAFQYQGRIYYRLLRDINIGEEILVWYDECYQQFMGVPTMDQLHYNNKGFKPKNSVVNRQGETNKSNKHKNKSPELNELSKNKIRRLSPPPNRDKQETRLETIEENNENLANHTAIDHSSTPGTNNNTFSHHNNSPGNDNTFSHHGNSPDHDNNTFSHHSNSPGNDNNTICYHGNSSGRDNNPSSHHGNSPGHDISSDRYGNSSYYHDNISSENSLDMSRDHSVEPLKCLQCCETFPNRIMLQMHVCSKQTNSPYHCGQCSLSFSNPSSLRSHVMSHVGEKPFNCGFCARSFVGATTLNNHIQMHTGRKQLIRKYSRLTKNIAS